MLSTTIKKAAATICSHSRLSVHQLSPGHCRNPAATEHSWAGLLTFTFGKNSDSYSVFSGAPFGEASNDRLSPTKMSYRWLQRRLFHPWISHGSLLSTQSCALWV